jgi:hypothetical protein
MVRSKYESPVKPHHSFVYALYIYIYVLVKKTHTNYSAITTFIISVLNTHSRYWKARIIKKVFKTTDHYYNSTTYNNKQ